MATAGATATGTEQVPYECDLIMKGGITSGIVYPPAIVEIARDHRLRNIGGSSAGAIAAVAAAAAELGRGSRTGGFDLLAALPEQLAEVDAEGRTRLLRLFQAQPGTAELFDVLWTARRTKGAAGAVAIARKAAARGAVPRRVTAASVAAVVVAAILLVWAVVSGGSGGIAAAAVLVLLVVALTLAIRRVAKVVTGALRLKDEAPSSLARNGHGLCSGLTAPSSSDPALTDWLHDTIQRLAGRHDAGVDAETRRRPVTYGDLQAAGIKLVTMTTNLTEGSSEVFPLSSSGWAFRRSELEALLPDDVVRHLVDAGARVPAGAADRTAAMQRAGLCPLPAPEDLPILLGARLSLSFPILLSAVPLYAWMPLLEGPGWRPDYVRCWFSDGGITSNLPVHLFDKPLPGRPTYAINLSGGGDPMAEPGANLFRPLSAGPAAPVAGASIDGPLQLLAAVFDTMQNWSDNSLARSPGYRDRICTVRLGAGEGGMNLDMPPATIRGLVARGSAAGRNLAWMRRGRCDGCLAPPHLDADKLAHQWDRHRFVRYRSFLGCLGTYLDRASGGFEDGQYAALGRAAVRDRWLPYRKGWSAARSAGVEADLGTLFDLDGARMTTGAPAGIGLGFTPRPTGDD